MARPGRHLPVVQFVGVSVTEGMQQFWPAPPQSSGPSQITATPPAHSSGEVHVSRGADDDPLTQQTWPVLQRALRHLTPTWPIGQQSWLSHV
jgi:hypothetical protein